MKTYRATVNLPRDGGGVIRAGTEFECSATRAKELGNLVVEVTAEDRKRSGQPRTVAAQDDEPTQTLPE